MLADIEGIGVLPPGVDACGDGLGSVVGIDGTSRGEAGWQGLKTNPGVSAGARQKSDNMRMRWAWHATMLCTRQEKCSARTAV